MRKIKIMLFSLLVLGVVGGALAFKAKFNVSYCTSAIPFGQINCTAPGGVNVTCPNMVASTTIDGTTNLCYTVPTPGQGCKPLAGTLRCITTPRLLIQDGGGGGGGGCPCCF